MCMLNNVALPFSGWLFNKTTGGLRFSRIIKSISSVASENAIETRGDHHRYQKTSP